MAISLVLFDSCKKYYIVQDELPMRKNGTPSRDADLRAFYDKWLSLVSKEFNRMNWIKESDQVTHTITWLKLNKNLMSSRRIALHRFWPAPSHQLGTGTLWRYWSTTRGSGTRENEERTSQHDLQKYQISSNGNSNIKYARETWQ